MSLRRRLLLLLGVFAVYAVVAAGITIYGNQWRVQGAVASLERAMGRTMQVDRLHLLLTEQMFHLRDVVAGRRDAMKRYSATRDEFFTKLPQATSFAPDMTDGLQWPEIRRLAKSFEEESNQCLALVEEKKYEEAGDLLTARLAGALVSELDSRLLSARTLLNDAQNRSARDVAATSSRILALTIIVGLLAAGLVLVGATLIRRWLITPIAELQKATRRFSEGDLAFRTIVRSRDELGQLGTALNEMARSLAASERKHRTLFANLHDAVVVCDIDGKIVEYHDGDTRLLAVEGAEHTGRYVLDVWQEWRSAVADWPAIIKTAITDGRRFQITDVELSSIANGKTRAFADFLVYRVEYGEARYAAIVVRDVTERHHLQTKLRRAETMEAVGTMAGGLAHDVNNLLVSVAATLSSLATDLAGSKHAERIRAALRACRRAAGLSKRLLNFASSAHENPLLFCPADIIELIIDSLDPSFMHGIDVQKKLDCSVSVRMGQDQFAQAVLNLLRNARDAMPDGGRLLISVEPTTACDPVEGTEERPYALLVVQDTGRGIAPEVQNRIFEPFFTTRSRTAGRGHGMGLAIVYSAVNNAGGFVQVESELGVGTTFRIYLPICDSAVEAAESAPASAIVLQQ